MIYDVFSLGVYNKDYAWTQLTPGISTNEVVDQVVVEAVVVEA